MPSVSPKKRRTKSEKLGELADSTISGIFSRDRSALGRQPVPTIAKLDVREALRRNRTYGDLPLALIDPDPDNVRKVDTTSENFKDLTASIAEHGVIESISVRFLEAKKRFQIITGHRRFLAAKKVGLETIPAIVRDVTDDQKTVHQLVENVQREGMNPIEEAKTYHRLSGIGWTQAKIAKQVSKSQSYVSMTMGLLEKLDRKEQAALAELQGPDIPGKALLFEAVRLEDPKTRLAILQGKVTWEEAREHVNHRRATGSKAPRAKQFTRRFRSEKPNATVTVSFKKSSVSAREVLDALDQARHEMTKEVVHRKAR